MDSGAHLEKFHPDAHYHVYEISFFASLCKFFVKTLIFCKYVISSRFRTFFLHFLGGLARNLLKSSVFSSRHGHCFLFLQCLAKTKNYCQPKGNKGGIHRRYRSLEAK